MRAFANRSIVSSALMRPDSLAAERQAEALETAIVERRRIELERYATVGSFADSPNGSFRVWPLQLLFHNIGWYLVFEEDAIGTGVGLIRSERIDRLALRLSERGNRRSDEAHSQALRRLEQLLHHSGGIYFGNDLKSQLRLASPNARIRAKQLVTLRFCCQGWCFAFIREGGHRAEQHLISGLMFPVMNGVRMMEMVGPGQRQPDIQIRQVGRRAHGSSSSNRAALLSWWCWMASAPFSRGSVAAERLSSARVVAALRPCST
ncbi:MAG: WYL domain-containing protein [Cyanobacteriota bacterium]